MNHTRVPKEVILPDWSRRNNQVTKGDGADDSKHVCNLHGTLINGQQIPKDVQANTNALILDNIPEFVRNEEVTQNFSRYILSLFIT
jgi:hypothetical protein